MFNEPGQVTRTTVRATPTPGGETRVLLETFEGRTNVVIRAFFWNRKEARMVPSSQAVRLPPEAAEEILAGLRQAVALLADGRPG